MLALAYPLAGSILCLLVIAPSCMYGSQLTIPSSLEMGFRVSPSQISLQLGNFRPFLTSPSSNLSLGFEDVGNGYVLAIMYNIMRSSNGSDEQLEPPLNMEMVWSANSLSPSTKDGTFAITQQGDLLLSDASKGTLWSTGTSTTGPTKLFLEDSGNLILSSSISDTNAHTPTIWQSFDHPTDTLLQGQNFTASMRLTASLSGSVTASVFFKMEVNGIALYADLGQNASQLMYWKLEADQETAVIDSQEGPIYARMDSMGYLGMYQTEDDRVSYEVFHTYNSTEVMHRRLKLDSDGNLRVYYWINMSWAIDFEAVMQPCSLPSACGPYGVCNMSGECTCAGGAVISSNVSAERHENVSFASFNESNVKQGCVLVNAESLMDDGCTSDNSYRGLFMQLVGMDSIFHAMARAHVNASSVDACEGLCRTGCSCIAFFYSKGYASRCFLTYQTSELSLVQTGNSDDLGFIKLSSAAAAAMASYRSQPAIRTLPTGLSRSVAAPIIAAIGGLLVVGSMCALAGWRYRRKRVPDEAGLEKKAFLSENIQGLPAFVSSGELRVMTSDFKRFRYAGPLGKLYEGRLGTGVRVAIARLTLLNQSDLHSVKLILASVGRMTHPSLAALCCYSIEGSNLALGYELPPNGWLDLAALTWQQRVEVCFGVAKALAALHEGGKMAHGLLTLEAVFIAGGCEAKVGGLGVAELVASGLATPLNLAAQPGILPPNLAASGDVYQFGVVLTELLTGERVISDAATWRIRWRDAIGEGRPSQLLDPAIVADASCAQGNIVARLATSAGLCLQPAPLQRPFISTVIRILEGSLTNLPLA